MIYGIGPIKKHKDFERTKLINIKIGYKKSKFYTLIIVVRNRAGWIGQILYTLRWFRIWLRSIKLERKKEIVSFKIYKRIYWLKII